MTSLGDFVSGEIQRLTLNLAVKFSVKIEFGPSLSKLLVDDEYGHSRSGNKDDGFCRSEFQHVGSDGHS